jgi:hypothetical protein
MMCTKMPVVLSCTQFEAGRQTIHMRDCGPIADELCGRYYCEIYIRRFTSQTCFIHVGALERSLGGHNGLSGTLDSGKFCLVLSL